MTYIFEKIRKNTEKIVNGRKRVRKAHDDANAHAILNSVEAGQKMVGNANKIEK